MENLTQEQLLVLQEKAKLIEVKPVISNNILGIGYDTENKLLKVIFNSKNGGNSYLYENVEPHIYEELEKSESIGKKLHELIIKNKEKYKYIRIGGI